MVDSLGCDAVGIRWRSKAESDETRRNKRHTMATHRKRVKECEREGGRVDIAVLCVARTERYLNKILSKTRVLSRLYLVYCVIGHDEL